MNTRYISRFVALALFAAVGCEGEPVTEPQDAAAAEVESGRQWRVGESFVYEISSARTVSLGGFSSQFEGGLAITVVGVEPDGSVHLRGDVRSPRYTQSPAQELTAELLRPFYWTARRSGELGSFRFTRGTSSGAAAVQRELALSLQLVEAEPGAASWQTRERDATGEYDARYTRTRDGIHKSKVRYRAAVAGMDDLAVDAAVDFAVDDSGWPQRVREQESVTAAAGELVVTATKTSSARLVTIERRPQLVGTQDASELITDTAIDATARALAKIQADQGLVDGQTFEQIAADLAASEVMTRNFAQRRLAALIRLDASAAAAAKTAVLAGRGDVNSKRRTIAALGTAGTEPAQHALTTLLDAGELGADHTVDVLVALALTKRPTAATAQAIQRATRAERTIATTAILAAGNVVRNMRLQGSGDGAAALQTLVDGLEEAASDQDRVLYLEALGNTGDARALTAIEPYLGDARVEVRAAATHGLRFVAGERADAAIVTALSDPEPAVQRAAARTLRHRSIAPMLPAIATLLASDLDTATHDVVAAALRANRRELAAIASDGATAQARQLARELAPAP